jgi:uncharacterized protein DUF6252
MRRLHALAVLLPFGLACGNVSEPSLAGPPLLSALIDGTLWRERPGQEPSARITAEGTLVAEGLVGDTVSFEALGFQVGHFHGPGRYALGDTPDPGPVSLGHYSVFAGRSLSLVRAYSTGVDHRGEVNVTALDSAAHTLLGTFSFTAAEVGGSSVVHVTKGQFRLSYQ